MSQKEENPNISRIVLGFPTKICFLPFYNFELFFSLSLILPLCSHGSLPLSDPFPAPNLSFPFLLSLQFDAFCSPSACVPQPRHPCRALFVKQAVCSSGGTWEVGLPGGKGRWAVVTTHCSVAVPVLLLCVLVCVKTRDHRGKTGRRRCPRSAQE